MAFWHTLRWRFARIGEQFLRCGFQSIGQAEDDGQARVGCAVLYAVEEGASHAHHESELLLCDLCLLAKARDIAPEDDGSLASVVQGCML